MQVYFKSFLLILTLLCVKALPLDSVQVKNYTSELSSNSYSFAYELSNDSQRYEEGILSEKNGIEFYKVTGFYKYRGTDGKIYIVNYSSDDRGYKASMSILEDNLLGFAPVLDPNAIKSLLG